MSVWVVSCIYHTCNDMTVLCSIFLYESKAREFAKKKQNEISVDSVEFIVERFSVIL